MKGLTPQQLIDITNFIQKHHEFGYVMQENRIKGNLGYGIKYIDPCYDSRIGDFWCITFRGFGSISFSTNVFLLSDKKPESFPFTNLYDWIMAYLNYEWEPKGKEWKFMAKDSNYFLENFVLSCKDYQLLSEFNFIDMAEAYCADLEDGITSEDRAAAYKWITAYQEKRTKGIYEARDKGIMVPAVQQAIDNGNERIEYLRKTELEAIAELDLLMAGSPERQLKWQFIRELAARRAELEMFIKSIESLLPIWYKNMKAQQAKESGEKNINN